MSGAVPSLPLKIKACTEATSLFTLFRGRRACLLIFVLNNLCYTIVIFYPLLSFFKFYYPKEEHETLFFVWVKWKNTP